MVCSRFFWACVDFIIIVAGAVESLSSWTELCSCHNRANNSSSRSALALVCFWIGFTHTHTLDILDIKWIVLAIRGDMNPINQQLCLEVDVEERNCSSNAAYLKAQF